MNIERQTISLNGLRFFSYHGAEVQEAVAGAWYRVDVDICADVRQDSIGICIPGLCRHYYNNRFWPEKIETCNDEAVLSWLENHLVMIPMEPRKPGCSVLEGKDITEPKVKALANVCIIMISFFFSSFFF